MRFMIVLMLLAVAGCEGSEDPVERVGYFKSDIRDRIFTARMSETATEQDARTFAETRKYTDGQMTAVYIYDHDAKIPADGITQARDIFHANEVKRLPGLSAWHYAYMRDRKGDAYFVDCKKAKHDLCRNDE